MEPLSQGSSGLKIIVASENLGNILKKSFHALKVFNLSLNWKRLNKQPFRFIFQFSKGILNFLCFWFFSKTFWSKRDLRMFMRNQTTSGANEPFWDERIYGFLFSLFLASPVLTSCNKFGFENVNTNWEGARKLLKNIFTFHFINFNTHIFKSDYVIQSLEGWRNKEEKSCNEMRKSGRARMRKIQLANLLPVV